MRPRRGSDPAMTERRRRPAALPTVLLALACFAVAFEFLALQLHAGRDPALGDASASSAPAKAKPRRKIIITRVVAPSSGVTVSQADATSVSTPAAPAPVATSSS